MVKKIVIVILLIQCFYKGMAQDTIRTNDGGHLLVHLVKVSSNKIKYKELNDLYGPSFVLLSSEVSYIGYSNKEIVTNNSNASYLKRMNVADVEMFDRGFSDAYNHYTSFKNPATVTLITGLVSPLLGLIPAIGCSAEYPKKENLNYPSEELIKNLDYYKGYRTNALKIKKRAVWSNWGIALGVNLVFFAVLVY